MSETTWCDATTIKPPILEDMKRSIVEAMRGLPPMQKALRSVGVSREVMDQLETFTQKIGSPQEATLSSICGTPIAVRNEFPPGSWCETFADGSKAMHLGNGTTLKFPPIGQMF